MSPGSKGRAGLGQPQEAAQQVPGWAVGRTQAGSWGSSEQRPGQMARRCLWVGEPHVLRLWGDHRPQRTWDCNKAGAPSPRATSLCLQKPADQRPAP